MFTVKHVTLAGFEFLYETKSAHYAPPTPPGVQGSVAPESLPALVCVGGEDGPNCLQGGTVFVMNEAGATVSRWDLGASNLPLSHIDARRQSEAAANI